MKIKKIRRISLEHQVPLYDLAVSGTHNFCLKGGEVVHNSKDVADACAGTIAVLSKRKASYKKLDKPQTLGEMKKMSGIDDKKDNRPTLGLRPRSGNRPTRWYRR
jgi:hypothetical protein